MRPVGSVNGRIPPGGYPDVSDADGAFLAGFLEGEACFSIVKQTRGQSYRCTVATSCRADDGPLLAELADRTRLGSLTSKPARATSRAQVTWSITAKADCLRLTSLLDEFPLRGRKSHDYALWRPAVHWWLDGDPSARRFGRDWAPMAYLNRRLQEVKRFEAATSPLILDPSGLFGDWGGFLAGFLTAEGHLGIAPVAPERVRPRLSVHVRADDRELLDQLAARADAGTVRGPYRNEPSSPSVTWSIVGLDALERVTAILDQHQLRGRKRDEFVLWRQAVSVYRRHAPAFEKELARLHRELARLRASIDLT